MLLGIAEAARLMSKMGKKKISTRWLYRHIGEYKTEVVPMEVLRVVFDDKTGKPVKMKKAK